GTCPAEMDSLAPPTGASRGRNHHVHRRRRTARDPDHHPADLGAL
ncbi:MAG: hypothetical protein AVDCRST_MAG49-447, partial [uncultured Thermomicrobiales bacterium]